MPATYEPIASQTLGSAASLVTFSSIPGTFTDLILVSMCGSSGTDSALFCRVNSNTGTTDYSRTMLYYRSSATSARVSNDSGMRIGNRIADGTPTTPSRAQFMSYVNTNVFKTILTESAASAQEVGRFVGLWRSTSAISTIYLFPDSGLDFVTGSTFSLFGLKAA